MPKVFSVVCRVAPLKEGNLRGAHVHQTRTHATPIENIDPARLHLNRTLYGTGNVQGDVLAVLAGVPKAHPKSSVCAELVLSADDEYFDRICPGWRDGKTSKAFEKWVSLNVKFLKESYPGLASMVLHMDEGTPHIHAMIVPSSTYEVAFRRGSKVVSRVNYNRIFGDTAQVIAEARLTKNSELTKLGRLQTAYSEAMKPSGLVRGIKNSRAHHRTVKEHQNLVNTPVITPVIPKLAVIERSIVDTLKSSVGIDTETDRRIVKASKKLNTYCKNLGKYQQQLAAKAQEYDKMKYDNTDMRGQLVMKDSAISTLTKQLDLSKEEVSQLRQSPLADVALALCFDGAIQNDDGKPRWRNAIDMVKEIAGLDYNQSVAFLYHEIGKSKTVDAVAVHAVQEAERKVNVITTRNADRPYTRQEYAIRQELSKQLVGLSSATYRITMMSEVANRSYNVGKGKSADGSERFYTADEVLALVPKLNNENWRRDYNVFITPIDPDKHYVLIDDLTTLSLDRMKADGYVPNVVHQSSTKSVQAVFVVPKSDVQKDVGNAFFREMNNTYGDMNIQGFVHPFRAVGFRNIKPKHKIEASGRFPVVKLLERVEAVCRKALETCLAIATATAGLCKLPVPEKEQKRLYEAVERTVYASPERTVDDHHLTDNARQFYAWCSERWGADVDWSRADWMLIQRLTKAGHPVDLVAAIIREASPGLDERHPLKARYIATTLTNAVLTPKP